MKCPRCKKNKPPKSFNKNKAQARGYQSYCKACMKAAIDKWQQKDLGHAREGFRKRFNKFYGAVHGRATHMLNGARQRARRVGKKCTLTRAWIERRLTANECEVTGLPFVLKINGGRGHRVNGLSPSIDRINNEKDYTPNNCRVVVWMFNRAKGAFPIEQFNAVVAAYCVRQQLHPN